MRSQRVPPICTLRDAHGRRVDVQLKTQCFLQGGRPAGVPKNRSWRANGGPALRWERLVPLTGWGEA
eukprot:12002908-Alexandrium_andersonii.AAC.1